MQKSWGDFALPSSFLRRIGFSVLRYLVILQFLLGTSRLPIDVQTSSITAAYTDHHMEGALLHLQSYDEFAASHVRRIATIHQSMRDNGEKPTARNIARRLSKAAREEVNSGLINEIMSVLDRVEKEGPSGFVVDADPKEKSAKIFAERQKWLERLKQNERKRNERRLRELRKARIAEQAACLSDPSPGNVIEFPSKVQPDDTQLAKAG